MKSPARTWFSRALGRTAAGYESAARAPSGLVIVFVVGTLLAAWNTVLRDFPPPAAHDELSYMLGADTFAHGRLTNPTHPMWRYFETFHVIQRPSYASKYPPAQALMLAAGQVTTGNAVVAVWVSFGLMCAALLWMLRAWTRPGWALGIALASAFALAATYWSFGYWGGALPAIGGALLYGACRRVVDRDEPGPALPLALGSGLLILANSRPYEGLLASVPVAAILAWWLMRRADPGRARRALRLFVPLALVLTAGGVLMAIYNAAVTGHWYEMPYLVYQRQYDPIPLFSFQGLRPVPPPPNEAFAAQVAWGHTFMRPFTLPAYLERCGVIVAFICRFLLAPAALWLPLAVLPIAARRRWTAAAIVSVVFVVLGMGLSTYYGWHYCAPIAACFLVVWCECLIVISQYRFRRIAVGRWLALGAVLLLAGWGVVESLTFRSAPQGWRTEAGPRWPWARRDLQAWLEQRGGKHLVLVAYGPSHAVPCEWVYNGAVIDGAPVVWARDLGPEQERPLLAYFRQRTQWRLYVANDSTQFILKPVVPSTVAANDAAALSERISARRIRDSRP